MWLHIILSGQKQKKTAMKQLLQYLYFWQVNGIKCEKFMLYEILLKWQVSYRCSNSNWLLVYREHQVIICIVGQFRKKHLFLRMHTNDICHFSTLREDYTDILIITFVIHWYICMYRFA